MNDTEFNNYMKGIVDKLQGKRPGTVMKLAAGTELFSFTVLVAPVGHDKGYISPDDEGVREFVSADSVPSEAIDKIMTELKEKDLI